MPAIGGGRDEGLDALAQKIVLVRQSAHPLVIDQKPHAPELVGDAAVAAMAVVERDRLDEIAQVRIIALGRMGAEMPVVAGARHPAQRAQPFNVGVVLAEALRPGGDHFWMTA